MYLKFSTIVLDELEYQEFLDECRILEENNLLNEGFTLDAINKFSSKLKIKFKKAFELAKNIAEKFKIKFNDIIKIFKIKEVFTFIKQLGFSLSKLVQLVKTGYKKYLEIHDIIAKYVEDLGIVKWTEDKLKDLDEFLINHPKIKRISGLIVAGILIYIWWNMSFAGDIQGDFDQSQLFAALSGTYTLSDIFAGKDGIKMLLLFSTGVLTSISFPWPGKSHYQFIYSILYTVIKEKKLNIKLPSISKIKGIKE